MGLNPTCKIEANGKDITAIINKRLENISVSDEAGFSSDTLDIVLDDSGEGIQLPSRGAELKVYLGYDNKNTYIGLFVVDKVNISGPVSLLKIKAAGAPFKSSKNYGHLQEQKSRSWNNVSLGSVVKKIASEHGLKPVIGKELQGIIIKHSDQTNESDVNFLVRKAKKYGATLKISGGNLLFIKSGTGKSANGKDLPVINVKPEDLSEWDVGIGEKQNYKTVVATYRDKSLAKDIEVRSGSGKPEYRIKYRYADADSARKAAQSKLQDLQRSSGEIELTFCQGRPDVFAEGRIKTSGFRDGANGLWTIKSVQHSFSKSGFTTSCTGEACV